MNMERQKELEAKLTEMQAASDMFYQVAQNIGVHRYLEHAGLMNEFVKICRHMLTEGLDFETEEPVPYGAHNLEYIGEKIGCMYGHLLDPEGPLWEAFVDGLTK